MCMFLVAPSWMDIDDAFPEYFQMIPRTGGNSLGGVYLLIPQITIFLNKRNLCECVQTGYFWDYLIALVTWFYFSKLKNELINFT